MSRGGTARNSKKSPKTPPKVIVLPESNLVERLGLVEEEIKKTAELRVECVEYLEKELKKALEQEGNDVKVQRLLKGIDERHRRASELEATLRRSRSAGLAPPTTGGQKDFAGRMAAKRAKA